MKYRLHIIFIFLLINVITLHSQWFQQTLPVNGVINDLVFFNKDTGLAALDNSNFLRTTNGGTNWALISNFRVHVLNRIDSVTVYGMGAINSKIYRTYDGGTTWDSVSPVSALCWISFISRDTGWLSSLGGIYKTTNGGVSAFQISSQASCGILCFLKTKYNNQYHGFIMDNGLYKTTNSGVNWSNVAGVSYNGGNLFFLNKDTGWVTDRPPLGSPQILFTANAGINWTQQLTSAGVGEVFFANINKGWCGSGDFFMYATLNNGLNWGTQISPIYMPGKGLFFLDSLRGWAFNGFSFSNVIKTTNGGGNITGIELINNYIPSKFNLSQNYPNPFNPRTVIEFSLNENSTVSLILYDLLGREILKIIDNVFLKAGSYKTQADVAGTNLSSGIYFYTLKAINKNTNYLETKKMVFIK